MNSAINCHLNMGAGLGTAAICGVSFGGSARASSMYFSTDEQQLFAQSAITSSQTAFSSLFQRTDFNIPKVDLSVAQVGIKSLIHEQDDKWGWEDGIKWRKLKKSVEPVPVAKDDGIEWGVFLNYGKVGSRIRAFGSYRMYLNPSPAMFNSALIFAASLLAHPESPDRAAFKYIQVDALGKKRIPKYTKLVFYLQTARDLADLVKLALRFRKLDKLTVGATVLSKTLPVNRLIQVLGGAREDFVIRDASTVKRTREILDTFVREGIIPEIN